MSLGDELSKLQDLHLRGALTDEEFSRAKARLLDVGPAASGRPEVGPTLAAVNALRRSNSDRWIAGVCGGIARATGIESWILRLLGVVLAMFGGAGIVLYLLLWIFVPSE
ncbi:MAG: PspC domain-containing protein [Rhizobacter sp.]|nr:PspC domain-containing protein [Rhizobacter sp.]